jgi:hypothetical protein
MFSLDDSLPNDVGWLYEGASEKRDSEGSPAVHEAEFRVVLVFDEGEGLVTGGPPSLIRPRFVGSNTTSLV